jgi:hypothetical protein
LAGILEFGTQDGCFSWSPKPPFLDLLSFKCVFRRRLAALRHCAPSALRFAAEPIEPLNG